MKAKIKSIHDYDEKTASCDCAWLLMNIKAVTLQFDDKQNGYMSILDAMAGFLNCVVSNQDKPPTLTWKP